jgi:hypothetical protein
MEVNNPTKKQVRAELKKKYDIPHIVQDLYFDLGKPALGTLVPARNGGGRGRVVHLNGSGGCGPMVQAPSQLDHIKQKIDALTLSGDTDAPANITGGTEQSALMGVAGFLKNAGQLRIFVQFVESDLRDGIPSPPEQLMEWQQFQRITNQYDSVQTLVQLAGNKLISISDTSFFMEEARLGVEHPKEVILSMLPSAGYLQRFCIHINMNTSSSDDDEVIFNVVAKSVKDYICEDIISRLVWIALQDTRVGKFLLESSNL